jgi:hypothetical protein
MGLYTYYFMQRNPFRDDDSCSGSQEFRSLLWNQRFHYVHKTIQQYSILRKLDPVHILTPYFFKI